MHSPKLLYLDNQIPQICEVIGIECIGEWKSVPWTIDEWASQPANGPVLASGVELLAE